MSARTILIGDVHGCRAELDELLERVALTKEDRVVFVGDLVVRGPDPKGVIDRAIEIGARAVRGNHEDRLLRFRARPASKIPPVLRESITFTLSELSSRHFSFLAQLPYRIELPEHDVCVVHAGVMPGVPLHEQNPRVLMNIRSLSPAAQPIEDRGFESWARHYERGPKDRHVVFGHNAQDEPQIWQDATGIDTGAVYGRHLTALVLPAGSPVPGPRDRPDALVRVPARTCYA